MTDFAGAYAVRYWSDGIECYAVAPNGFAKRFSKVKADKVRDNIERVKTQGAAARGVEPPRLAEVIPYDQVPEKIRAGSDG